MKIKPLNVGKWRIKSMEQWDMDFVDMSEQGHFTIRKDGTGSFQFGAVQGEMDCRVVPFEGVESQSSSSIRALNGLRQKAGDWHGADRSGNGPYD